MKIDLADGRRSDAGLALVEVLVALAIVAFALPALLYSVDRVTDSTGHLRDKAIARWVASDRLAEARIDRLGGEVLEGQSSGEVEMAKQLWRWRMTARKTDVPGVQQLEVTVSRDSEGSDPLVTLIGALEE